MAAHKKIKSRYWTPALTVPFVEAIHSYRQKYYTTHGEDFNPNHLNHFVAISAATAWPQNDKFPPKDCQVKYMTLKRLMRESNNSLSRAVRHTCSKLGIFQPLPEAPKRVEPPTMASRKSKRAVVLSKYKNTPGPSSAELETDSESDMDEVSFSEPSPPHIEPIIEEVHSQAPVQSNLNSLGPLAPVLPPVMLPRAEPIAAVTVNLPEPKKRKLEIDEQPIQQDIIHRVDLAALEKDRAVPDIPLEHAKLVAEQERFHATERRLNLERELEREKMFIMRDLEMRKLEVELKKAESEATEKAKQNALMEKMFLMMMGRDKSS